MKTTLDIPDALIREIKAIAASEGTSMRSVVEDALRRELERRRSVPEWQPRPDLVYGGDGLTDEAAGLTWEEIRYQSSRLSRLEQQLRESLVQE